MPLAVASRSGRDQVTASAQYTEGNAMHQDVARTYDGYGRLKTVHLPEQNVNTATTYNYNADDSISSVVDARDAGINYTYNSRGLVELISYAVLDDPNNPGNPHPAIPDMPDVSFSYDNAGNRLSMQDGLGTVNYTYNSLSQMMTETRTFADSMANAPAANNGFQLDYAYALSGRLASLRDAYGQQFNSACAGVQDTLFSLEKHLEKMDNADTELERSDESIRYTFREPTAERQFQPHLIYTKFLTGSTNFLETPRELNYLIIFCYYFLVGKILYRQDQNSVRPFSS